MKTNATSPRLRNLRELLGLVLIGFVLWLAAIGWLPVSAASAAPGGPRSSTPEQRLAQMQIKLDLTDEQMEQIRPILAAQAAKAQDIRNHYQGQDRRRMRAEIRELREETRTALATVLTAEQLVKWQQLRDERQRKRQRSRSTGPHP